jgi:Tol biopolymer transport system component
MRVFVKPTTGSGGEELLPAGTDTQLVDDWSPDGRFVLYSTLAGIANEVKKNARDLYQAEIWAAPTSGARKAFPVVRTPYRAGTGGGQFSPDSKWIAFVSNESGRYEIFVQPFPGPGEKHQVSAGGGVQARWRADGRELFYLAPDNRLMAVPISVDSPDSAPAIGSPVPLFAAHLSGSPQALTVRSYSVSRDGQRFLMDVPVETALPVTVILNWKPRP